MWTTELHLSFLQLVSVRVKEGDEDQAIFAQNVCDGRQRRFALAIKGSQQDIFKASLSYRVVGDMGDKYWTAYLLMYLPGSSRLLEYPEEYESVTKLKEWFHEKTRNDQRKILEPFLVEKITAEAYQSTATLLKYIDDWLDPEVEPCKVETGSTSSTFSKADDRNFDVQYNRSTTCLELDATLSVVRRLAKANVDSLTQWSIREKTRHVNPRWSEKDEYHFREMVDHQK